MVALTAVALLVSDFFLGLNPARLRKFVLGPVAARVLCVEARSLALTAIALAFSVS